ncbi:MAG TPA: hypothetical protein VK487_09390 [Candidatus Bathyarchaeia archaeon]|nr:hypothetical protein [Candidatus Bathyarchaeia archaeon]
MSEDQVRLKIVKDTVTDSIISEVNEKLEESIPDVEKRKEMMSLTRSKLTAILNSLGKEELLPRKDLESQRDFEEHVLKLVSEVRRKLLSEMKKEN